MNYYLVVVFSYSIIIAAIAGIFKIKKAGSYYLPFILYTCIAAVNEMISYYSSKQYHSNAINNNVYALVETLLIIYQFNRWNFFERKRKLYQVILICTCLLWLWEYHDLDSLRNVHLYFRLCTAFIIVLMSIHVNSKLIITYRKNLLTHPVFLICSGFILFYTFEILTETFWIYGINVYPEFQSRIFYIMIWTNLFVNFIYATAILCIPTKPRFIQLY